MNKSYCIYKHILPKKISGKNNDMVYIGLTSQKPERRWANGLGYTYNSYFYRAIQKYGWDNFVHEILFSGLTFDEANRKEIELIEFYNSTDRSYGYNLQTGGRNGFEYTDDIIEKLKEVHGGVNNGMYGKHHSDESKEIMSNKKKQFLSKKTNHPMYGKHHSDESKQLISQNAKERQKNGSPLKGKALSDKTKNKLSKSAKERLSIPENNPFYGKHHSEKTRKKLSEMFSDGRNAGSNNPNYGNTKRVICLDTNEVYSSVKEVSEKFGLSTTSLYMNCTGKTNRCGGFCFGYLDSTNKEVC